MISWLREVDTFCGSNACDEVEFIKLSVIMSKILAEYSRDACMIS